MSIFLKMNDMYYDITDSNYDTETKMYIGVSDMSTIVTDVTVDKLTTEVTIGDETFKPIDKFDNFQIVSNTNDELYISGRKISSSIIVLNPVELDSSVSRFISGISITGSDTIKIAISTDSGINWKTHNGQSYTNLNTVISADMTEEELTNLKEEIITSGITSSDLQNLSLENLYTNSITIAIVIRDDEEISDISLLYTETSHIKRMTNEEISFKMYERAIIGVAVNDEHNIRVHIMTREIYSNNTTVDERTILPAPTILISDPVNNTLTISWNAINNAGSYELYINDSIINVTGTSYELELSKDLYSFAVRALPSDNNLYRPSDLSTVVEYDNSTYLADAIGNTVTVTIGGTVYNLKVSGTK